MGVMKRFPGKVIIRFSIEEIMHARVYTDKDVTFTLATMIGKYAEMKAAEKKIDLPCKIVTVSFENSTSEFIVTFAERPEQALTP